MITKAEKRQRLARWIRGTLIVATLPILSIPAGCNRAHYRQRADQEVCELVNEKVVDASAPAIPSVQMRRESRMFDPFNPDRPPMPEDDDVAHQYMKVLNGKKHYPLWDVNGKTNTAENPVWWQYLPLDERGVLVLDANAAVRLATLHNTTYQQEIETLYLSALDVSTERFFLGNQLFAGYSAAYTADGKLRRGGGGNSSSTLSNGVFSRGARGIALQRQFTNGAEMIVGLANSLTWQLAGPDTQTATTVIDFSFIQPLLRGGGRDVVMERLTLAERTLLYNVRAFERYRTGFYLNVTVGRNNDAGPTRRGGLFGGAGLQGFTGLGGGFGTVGNVQNNAGAGFGGGGAVPQVGGFLGLVQNQLQIRNAEENVARLRDNLARFEDTLREQLTIIPASQDAIPSQQLQVAQARQALISAQATLLQSRFSYENSLDNFKGTLGLPPYVCIEIKDPILDQFNLISVNLRDRRAQIGDLREDIGDANTIILEESVIETDKSTGDKFRTLVWSDTTAQAISEIRNRIERLQNLRMIILQQDIQEIRTDLARLREVLPERERSLARLREMYEQERNTVCALLPTDSLDMALLESTDLPSLPDSLQAELDKIENRFLQREEILKKIDSDMQSVLASGQQQDKRKQYETLRDQAILPSQSLLAEFAEDALSLQVLQARARVESVILPEVDIAPEEAVEIARVNRLDWMNSRASLVDSWRAIEIVADNLESTLDVVFSGDIQNANDNPLSLRGKTGRLRAGLQWDSPLTRMQERNQYRQVLIEYQQAKRNYYRYEDAVWQQLRSEIRNLRYNQYNFELQRYAVRIAAQQIIINEDLRLIRENLSLASGPTAARDSVSALQDLLNAQNTFLGVWVFYEAQRRNLDQDLGTIRVDGENIWVDPGPITSEMYGFPRATPEVILEQETQTAKPWGGGEILPVSASVAPSDTLYRPDNRSANEPLSAGVQVAPQVQLR
ncbi:hypothetical protein VN12_03565 [Pirellula sp. SH-Sr6A]|uniref:hypothetical protein n=1 Tax=Pirellula sp. SH-Sr6A TaxID=1632865 RepID=UPI00078CEB6C|nr:hypothetical protein [Pirellula sp. SH-Sr6A]AMV31170.1 hypothetical protein VN12_03565 [Pirellula sp. SH-Sr6A]